MPLFTVLFLATSYKGPSHTRPNIFLLILAEGKIFKVMAPALSELLHFLGYLRKCIQEVYMLLNLFVFLLLVGLLLSGEEEGSQPRPYKDRGKISFPPPLVPIF